ncbi:MAG TPA: hypothetical protein VGJ63_23385 [Micromonosporaceae bacterium]|jgi:hypothetical protein
MADRIESWTERTVDMTPGPSSAFSPFQRGVAAVGRPVASGSDTLVETSGSRRQVMVPRPPLRYRLRRLRRGGEWTAIGALVAFVSWGIWAISLRGGSLTIPILAFVLVLLVGGGVFALSRLLGRVVLERSLGRARRSAWPSHLVTGVFLAAAGVAYLGQTDWVIDAWTWLRTLA